MRWLMNTSEYTAKRDIAYLCQGWKGRVIITGEPLETEGMLRSASQHQGMVGLYEKQPGVRSDGGNTGQ